MFKPSEECVTNYFLPRKKPPLKKHITEFPCGSTVRLTFDNGNHIPAQIIAVHPHFIVIVYKHEYKLDSKTNRLIFKLHGKILFTLPANGWEYNNPLP